MILQILKPTVDQFCGNLINQIFDFKSPLQREVSLHIFGDIPGAEEDSLDLRMVGEGFFGKLPM